MVFLPRLPRNIARRSLRRSRRRVAAPHSNVGKGVLPRDTSFLKKGMPRTSQKLLPGEGRALVLRTAASSGKVIAAGGAFAIGGVGLGAFSKQFLEGIGNIQRASIEPSEQRRTIVQLADRGILTPELLKELGGGPGPGGDATGGGTGLLLPAIAIGGVGLAIAGFVFLR